MLPVYAHDIAAILAGETGHDRSAAATAAGLVRACGKVLDQIAPLIGEAGACTLFARSLALTSMQFPFLAEPRREPASRPGDPLRSRIAERDAATASAAAVALLTTLIGMLIRFIGEDLAVRLIRAAWPAAFPSKPKESM
ncbi:MAG TPA: hypothetical protein VL172_12150 [Kofleriaceae bacterium]|nr:hypothetical protein [Kofleriaceae bacterium]